MIAAFFWLLQSIGYLTCCPITRYNAAILASITKQQRLRFVSYFPPGAWSKIVERFCSGAPWVRKPHRTGILSVQRGHAPGEQGSAREPPRQHLPGVASPKNIPSRMPTGRKLTAGVDAPSQPGRVPRSTTPPPLERGRASRAPSGSREGRRFEPFRRGRCNRWRNLQTPASESCHP